mmetsp:Transcript_20811/g.23269  ORF Transcript_20811/g.23269 Transcript_20811/m.23269 type:complete len:94 (-) Transcript_20811:123-404(-)
MYCIVLYGQYSTVVYHPPNPQYYCTYSTYVSSHQWLLYLLYNTTCTILLSLVFHRAGRRRIMESCISIQIITPPPPSPPGGGILLFDIEIAVI